MEEESNPDLNDMKIPVFTVLKNGAILKNIFIVNNIVDRESEEVIILGRHPDCNIMLTHPSISRFHLQIHSNPSSQKLCVVDLSSVHGTWVSGKRIEAGYRVKMGEGDTLKVGGSSRLYRLHWVPLSSAYDFECPKQKKEAEVPIVGEKIMEDCEKEISLLDENKKTVENSVFGNIESLYSVENWNMEMAKEVPLGPPLDEVEGMVMSSVDDVEIVSEFRNECEQEEARLLSIPLGNELNTLETSFQPPSLPISAENLSFNVENIIMSSFFGSESKSSSSNMFERSKSSSIWTIPLDNISSSLNGKQQCHSKIESHQPPSLPLSAENLSFNVENIIMSSFFDGESKSSSRNMFEWEETSSISTIPVKNKSNALSVVDDVKATPEIEYQQLANENKSPQPHSISLHKENSSDVEDTAMIASSDGECESPSRNKFEQKKISNIMTIPLGHELSHVAVVAEKNLSSTVADVEETQYLPVHEVKSLSSQPLLAFQSETVTEKYEFVVERELHHLEDECFSNSTEKGIWEMEMQAKSQAEVGAYCLDKGNEELYQVTEVVVAEKNLSSTVADVEETQYLPVHEVKSLSSQPLLAFQSETVTEKYEFVVERELHHLEDECFSNSTEKGIWEMEMQAKSQAEVGAYCLDKGNEELYQVTECLLDSRSEYKDCSLKTTSEVTPNSQMTQNVECCVEEKNNGRLETLETSKSISWKDCNLKELSEPSFLPCAMEFVYSSLPNAKLSPKTAVKKEGQTPHESLDATSSLRSENASGGNIWLRRGKPTCFPRIKTGVSQENCCRGTSLTDEIKHEIVGDKTVRSWQEEEEIFTPDKENFTPDTLLMKSLKKKANIEDSGNSFMSSKPQTSTFKSTHKVKQEEELSEESDKENQTPRILQEQKLAKQNSKNRRFEQDKIVNKRGGVERGPFQCLQSNFARKKRPEATVVKSARKSNISVCTGAMKNKFTVEGEKRWTMVVDVNSLLDKESMKSLQLLHGLHGTHLIVPRTVIRELDCLRRHGFLFRKTTEAASILQWIEDCMVQTSWWIHVQGLEEGEPPATPPATPQSPYTDGCSQSLFWRTASSIQSTTQRSFMEALSPTPEDHILDCALHFRRGVNHTQFVLISDDVSLKIKAMAEGLICETAKEFRESLVNPFSERFLWADSSPRGLTWSCPDDLVLRERYEHRSSRSSKGAEGAKGLKLILLHNSHYGMIR